MSGKILWIDDEVDLLRPHIVFLENKGYIVTPVNNVNEALEIIEKEKFELTLLDENMPGISGLEAIPMIKEKDNALKIVMVTKSEEEHIMEQAIGSQIADCRFHLSLVSEVVTVERGKVGRAPGGRFGRWHRKRDARRSLA